MTYIPITADLARKAADIIEERGLYQGGFGQTVQVDGIEVYPDDAPVCATGALYVALGKKPNGAKTNSPSGFCNEFVDVYADEVKAVFGGEGGSNPVAHFNDTEGRTKEEVAAKLRELADRLDLPFNLYDLVRCRRTKRLGTVVAVHPGTAVDVRWVADRHGYPVTTERVVRETVFYIKKVAG